MGTGDTWIELYPGKIMGWQDFDAKFSALLQEDQRQAHTDLWGGGGTYDAPTVWGYAGGLVSLAGDAVAWTPTGRRLTLDAGVDPGLADVPFEDTVAVVYSLGVHATDYPAGAEVGTDGMPGFSGWVEAVGREVIPSAVAALGGGVRLTLTGSMYPGEKWAGAGDTRAVVAWYASAAGRPATSSSEAVYAGDLELVGGQYVVDVPHIFGQSSLSLSAARYRVAILGPELAAPARAADPAFLAVATVLGTFTTGVWSSVGVRIVEAVGDWFAAYELEHDHTTGYHRTINHDGILHKLGGVSDWAFECNSAADQTIEIRNLHGAGVAHLTLVDGDLTLTAGSISAPAGDVEADTLTLTNADIDTTGNMNLNGYGSAFDGFIADPTSTEAGFQYDSAGSFDFDVAPIGGSWTSITAPVSAVPTFNLGETPPNLGTNHLTNSVTLIYGLSCDFLHNDDTVAAWEDDKIEIVSIVWRYKKVAGSTLTLDLYRTKRDGSGAAVSVGSDGPADSAVYTTSTFVLNHKVDPAYRYWLQLVIANSGGAGALTDCRVADVRVNLDKMAVE